MKGNMRTNSGISIRGRIYKRKLSSIFENPQHHPYEGFNCSGKKLIAPDLTTGTIKASFP